MKLSVVQLVSSPDIEQNFIAVSEQLATLTAESSKQPHLVVLPECFSIFGGKDALQTVHQEAWGDGPIQQKLSDLAREYGVWLVGGTIPVLFEGDERFSATSILFSPDGEAVSHYEKIHLFDVEVEDATGTYLESATTRPGERVVVADIEGIKVGFAVCYDLRFPGLFQALASQGADIIVLPSAFTDKTGEAHWSSLIRARAIENQVWMVAANQGGIHLNGRETWGHSMIVNPWGSIETEMDKGPGSVSVDFDVSVKQKLQQQMPVSRHNRFNSEFK